MSTSSQLLPDLEEAQPDPDDQADEEGGRDLEDDMKSKTGPTDCPRKWTSPECLAAVYAVMASNRVAPKSCNVLRAERAAESYLKFGADLVKQRLWTPGNNGHPSVEASHAKRCCFPLTGKSRGIGPMQNKVAWLKAEAQNVINPLHRKQLNSDGSMPSGNNKEEILVKTKAAYYQKTVEKDSKKAGQAMPKGM